MTAPVTHGSWVTWVMGQELNGSLGSWVTQSDPFPALVCALNFPDIYFARWCGCEVIIVMIRHMSVCVSVCLSVRYRISQDHTRDICQIFVACCHMPMALSSSYMLTIAASPVGGKGVKGVHSAAEV